MLSKNFLIIRVIYFSFHLLLILVLNYTQVFYTVFKIQFQRSYVRLLPSSRARSHVRFKAEDGACSVALVTKPHLIACVLNLPECMAVFLPSFFNTF